MSKQDVTVETKDHSWINVVATLGFTAAVLVVAVAIYQFSLALSIGLGLIGAGIAFREAAQGIRHLQHGKAEIIRAEGEAKARIIAARQQPILESEYVRRLDAGR